jgi:amidase
LIADNRLDALIAPSYTPAARIDLVGGDRIGGRSSALPAVSGYPHLTVPMGLAGGLPVGLSFIGPAWSEARLLALGYAYEQASHARKPPTYIPSLETTPDAKAAFAPVK